ncbi:hypothetical protein DFH08DRAFT_819300 [Mycena albidolilacea]|uniref:Uncharacterized protein n=1 Tax=Mycena albidolilacea TaxID=1033008 RepID=A0AAD6ZEX6_9AGAR|nr:hypothetical protein DFH08DRAFT_819300 [Mycena albidolilacea]
MTRPLNRAGFWVSVRRHEKGDGENLVVRRDGSTIGAGWVRRSFGSSVRRHEKGDGEKLVVRRGRPDQGPSTALKPDGCARGRAGNASINGITTLTDRDVGYVAIQGRLHFFSILVEVDNTLAGSLWGLLSRPLEPDGCGFNYRDFYWSVVDMLQGEEGQEILDRFNMKVFGTKSSAKKATPATTTVPKDFDILAAQRAAKRARKIAAAAESSASASN